ncbi:tyrosine 2,3-aminomutase [Nocardia asteroides]|uniref:tyrosine 2,3-aminomutase n=1 Tax=Nocardia asteroides TaxID=1824 RepID=UPI003787CF21
MIRISGSGLTVDDVYRIAVDCAAIEIDAGQLKAAHESSDRVKTWGSEGRPVYGVTTGFGEMVYMSIPAHFEVELQENLVRSHAAGGGPVFGTEISRAIMASRLNCLIRGYSGISGEALELMAEFLNRGIHPLVPQQGSLGASGDLAPLAHVALPLIGAGKVEYRGEIVDSAQAMASESLAPVRLGYKDGLALINGTSGMTGAASIAIVRAERLLRLALWASGAFVEVVRGSTRAFDHRGHELKNHQGQIRVAAAVRAHLAGSEMTLEHEEIMARISAARTSPDEVEKAPEYLQNAYTVRCIPQILGPVLDSIEYCRRIVEEELNSCNDNPLIFDLPESTFHGGNFHGQYVAMASDFLNIAVAEIGVLAERQLNRLLDPHLNKTYPPFLAIGNPGLFSGLQGSQYLATSIASENMDLAAPSSIKSIPSNGQNQDVVSMGLISARKSHALIDNVHTIVSVLVAAIYQASAIAGRGRFSEGTQEFLEILENKIEPYRDDREVASEYLAKIRLLSDSNEITEFLQRWAA